MFLKSESDGYLKIDHSASPGFTPEQAIAAGRSKLAGHIGEGKVYEGKTYTCSHCQRVVIANPDRLNQRAYCGKCDHDICDRCGIVMKVNGECMPFVKVIDHYAKTGAVPTTSIFRSY
jgi:ribosomal protein S27AE